MLAANHPSCLVSTDVHYRSLLDALHAINDEAVRNRCDKYGATMYQYWYQSVANERNLVSEEQRLRKELAIRTTSQRTNVVCRVRDILQRGHQILTDLHLDYDQLRKNRSEGGTSTIANQDRMPLSACNLTESPNHLKEQIYELYRTRTCQLIDPSHTSPL